MKKYKVTLTADERQQLRNLIAAGQAAAPKLAHARILLKADAAHGRPGLDRREDRRGGRGQHRHRRPGPPAVRRGRFGCRPVPREAGQAEPGANPGRAGRGPTDRPRLLPAARRPEAVDDATAGRRVDRTGGRARGLGRDGPPDASKTRSSRG